MRRIPGLRRALRVIFPYFEKVGVHVLPADYYSPIPERWALDDEFFARERACIGLDWNDALQHRMLAEVFPRYAGEVAPIENPGLSLADAAVLHCMVRYAKPRRVVEVGGGHSSRHIAAAVLLNEREGYKAEFVCIEPYPDVKLREGFDGLSRLIDKPVQRMPAEEIARADLLFIDSTHTVKAGGDVNYLILEVLPRVTAGTFIHFHDILLPGEYWREWLLDNQYFWAEQDLLQAFLLFNHEFEIVWAAQRMSRREPAGVQAVFPYFKPGWHHLSSFWIRRVAKA